MPKKPGSVSSTSTPPVKTCKQKDLLSRMEEFKNARSALTSPSSDGSVTVLQSRSISLPEEASASSQRLSAAQGSVSENGNTSYSSLASTSVPSSVGEARQTTSEFQGHARDVPFSLSELIRRSLWFIALALSVLAVGVGVWYAWKTYRDSSSPPPSVVVQAPAVTVNPHFEPELRVKADLVNTVQPIVLTPRVTCECPLTSDAQSDVQAKLGNIRYAGDFFPDPNEEVPSVARRGGQRAALQSDPDREPPAKQKTSTGAEAVLSHGKRLDQPHVEGAFSSVVATGPFAPFESRPKSQDSSMEG